MDHMDISQVLSYGEQRARAEVVTVSVPGLPVSFPLLVTREFNAEGEVVQKLHGLDDYADPYRETPKRRAGTAKIQNLASLIAHINRFKEDRSALFVNLTHTTPSLQAIYDYHDEVNTSDGTGSTEGKPLPRFLKHRALYEFPLSKEWKAWTAMDGKPMNQSQFAAFLEDRIMDVCPAPADDRDVQALTALMGGSFALPADLMTLAKGLKVTATENVTSAVNLSTGEGQINYEVSHQSNATSAQIKVPNAFMVLIPVFEMDAAYYMAARLRYRLAEGKVNWHYNLFRPEKRIDDALTKACDKVTDATALPLFAGQPEVSTVE